MSPRLVNPVSTQGTKIQEAIKMALIATQCNKLHYKKKLWLLRSAKAHQRLQIFYIRDMIRKKCELTEKYNSTVFSNKHCIIRLCMPYFEVLLITFMHANAT
jgi:hypothetical protein